MDNQWQSEFRERMIRFQNQGTPPGNLVPISIKIRVASGCFHREHSPHAYSIIDDFLAKAVRSGPHLEIHEHESGPEILVYLAVTTAGLSFAKSVVDLIAAIVKARSEGIKKGDQPSEPLELIVRGHSKTGDYFEKIVLRIPHDQPATAKAIGYALARHHEVEKPGNGDTKIRYKSVILGVDREVCGYSDNGHLILGNCERFEFSPMGVEPETFRSFTLRAIARLTFTGGQWLVDEVPLETYCVRQFSSPRTSESDTKFFTALALSGALKSNREVLGRSGYRFSSSSTAR